MKNKIWLDSNLRDDDRDLIRVLKNDPDMEVVLCTGVAAEDDSERIAEELNSLFEGKVKTIGGAGRPLACPNIYAPEMPAKDMAEAVEEIYRTLKDLDGLDIILCGGATNLAYLLNSHPDFREKIRKVLFIGGAYCFGTVTPVAETNAYFDPEALEVLLEKKLPLYFIPEELRMDGHLSLLAYPVLKNEKLFEFQKYKTGVEISADYTRGMTVIFRNGLDHFDYFEEGDDVRVEYVAVKEEDKNSYYPEIKDREALHRYIRNILGEGC